ncbi:MAG TPA: class I SAM-dependent methyltransferase [Terrimesophilobacter sp.]|nr:class I SAM-dependent methyltransferase [Terrimesophilobacter sp.]
MKRGESKRYWDEAARDNAAWHIATGHASEDEGFFARGAVETDHYLALAGLTLHDTDVIVEIGSGVGRMTRRLSELAGRVIATDVSGEMLGRARANLRDRGNVEFVEVSGEGELPLDDASTDAVFSYITMQHVPTVAAQERYFAEALRILRPGGWALIQYRRSGLVPRALDWAGHLGHLLAGRRTLHRAWRGARVDLTALRASAPATYSVELLPAGRRHAWILARSLN